MNPRNLLLIMSSMITGAVFGIAYMKQYTDQRWKILYVSQDEIIELEKARVKDDDPARKQLFFGEIERAVELATQLPRSYGDKHNKVVYSVSSVSGENVSSISGEIHRKIIEELGETRTINKSK